MEFQRNELKAFKLDASQVEFVLRFIDCRIEIEIPFENALGRKKKQMTA